jgi:hypothetical protein
MAVATYTDVAVALGRAISTPTEQAQVEWWLTGVELVIGNRLGDITLLNQDVLQYVEVESVVAKVQRHGQSESSITVAVDDGSVTRRYENSVSAGDILDEWWQMLDPDSSTSSASIRPYFEADTVMWPVRTPGYCNQAFDPDWVTP